jgi:hypothetical protein
MGAREIFFEMVEKKQLPDSWFFGRGGIGAWPRPKDGLAQKSTKVIHFGGSEVDDL